MKKNTPFWTRERQVLPESSKSRGSTPYSVRELSKIRPISREARVRLSIIEFAASHPIAVTCRHFGISRATYYRWKQRYDPKRLSTLENRSKRPKNVRKPKWTWQLCEHVRDLRERYPAYGKAKLRVLMQREGVAVSESMVGRILKYLRHRGVLREPMKEFRVVRAPRKRIYAVRKPRDYEVRAPGDIVQIDTLDIRRDNKGVYKQFSAVDVYSRYAFGDVRSTATASLAREFLERLVAESPFPVKAVQTDGGSEFYAEFEQACITLGIRFFCLPPRSPKLNGSVERLNRTYREEFWAFYEGEGVLEEMRPALQEWTRHEYNESRPHQALGYKAPAEFLDTLDVAGCLT